MPLLSGKANVGKNIAELMKTGRPQRQAIAISLDNARRHPRAAGGAMPEAPAWMTQQAAPHVTGLINAPTPGRTDKVPLDLLAGSYVIPADVVAGYGQGNSVNGGKVLADRFPGAPAHTHAAYARGGRVPIMAAGGEFVVHPHDVAKMGGGNMKRGHDALDRFVTNSRKKQIAHLKNLPGPKK